MGGGEFVKVEKIKPKKKENKDLATQQAEAQRYIDEALALEAQSMTIDTTSGAVMESPAEGTILLAPEIRRRQRSILGSLAREETKARGSLNVQEVRRLAHVTFDPEAQKFIGLPPEWEPAVNTAFGLPLSLCRGSLVPGYPSRIPNVLILMGKYLLDHGGRDVKGIFRLAPDQTERDTVLQQLANGTFVECNDIHCISTGIKVWFRELPVPIFRDLDEEKIKTCEADSDAASILARLPEPALSVVHWLMDLCVEIINNSIVNMMTAKNMSIVLTPNLYRVRDDANPQDMLFLAKKFTDFFERCLNNRVRDKESMVAALEAPSFSHQDSITFTLDLDEASTPKRVPIATTTTERASTTAEVAEGTQVDDRSSRTSVKTAEGEVQAAQATERGGMTSPSTTTEPEKHFDFVATTEASS